MLDGKAEQWSLDDPRVLLDPRTPRTHGRVRLYVWGYEFPESPFCRERCQPSVAARRFAAESGWDEARRGAWAKEMMLPVGLMAALQVVEPTLRLDPAVDGWGLRTV